MTKKNYKILAAVKFNSRIAYVLDKEPELTYKKVGNIIYGTDGLFYSCYEYSGMSPNRKAFAGREFDITLEDGEVINCVGQWWDGGFAEVEKITNCKIEHATINTLDKLKECYVFSGYEVDAEKFNQFIKSYTGGVYDYWEYEKIIKYDDMHKSYIEKIVKLEAAKASLIKSIKSIKPKIKRDE